MKETVYKEEKMEDSIEEFREDLHVIRNCLRNDRFEKARRATEALDNKLWKTLEKLKKEDKKT
jgi:hypothetical protein